jgi:hypothetical protein
VVVRTVWRSGCAVTPLLKVARITACADRSRGFWHAALCCREASLFGRGSRCKSRTVRRPRAGLSARPLRGVERPRATSSPAPERRAPGATPAVPGDHGAVGRVVDRLDARDVQQHRRAVPRAVDLKHGDPFGRRGQRTGQRGASAGGPGTVRGAGARHPAAACACVPPPGTGASGPCEAFP